MEVEIDQRLGQDICELHQCIRACPTEHWRVPFFNAQKCIYITQKKGILGMRRDNTYETISMGAIFAKWSVPIIEGKDSSIQDLNPIPSCIP